MTALALLKTLKAHGATVAADGEFLELTAPPGVLKPRVLDMVARHKAELLELLTAEVGAREYSEPVATAESCAVETPPGDGLHRVGAFIAPRLKDAAYRAHWEAKTASTPTVAKANRQAKRIRQLGEGVTPEELLTAYKRIKPTLKNSLDQTDLHELALTLAQADKQEKAKEESDRPAREVYACELYQSDKPTKGKNF